MPQKIIGLQKINKVIALRKKYFTLENISIKVGLSIYHVVDILKEYIGDDYSKYRRGQRYCTQETTNKIVELRKQKKKLKEISEAVDVSIPSIRQILKRELKDDYYFYSCRVRSLPEKIQKEIIHLCTEERYTLKQIAKHTGLSFSTVKSFLKKELGHRYHKYSHRLTPMRREEVFALARRGLSKSEIADKVNLSIETIRKILERSFYQIFDEITSETPFDEYKELKEEGYSFMQDIRGRIKKGVNLRNESKLSPIVLFLFFKMKFAHFTDDHYLAVSSLTREELRKGLKFVLPYFPEYQGRDKKILVIGSIKIPRLHFMW